MEPGTDVHYQAGDSREPERRLIGYKMVRPLRNGSDTLATEQALLMLEALSPEQDARMARLGWFRDGDMRWGIEVDKKDRAVALSCEAYYVRRDETESEG